MEQSKYYGKIALKLSVIIFIVLGLFIVYKLAIFYIPFIIAIIVASIVEPITKFFMRKCKLRRKISTIITLLLITIIIGTVLTLTISKVITETTSLLSNLNIYFKDFYDDGIQLFDDLKNGNIEVPDEVMQVLKNSLGGIVDGTKNVLISILTSVINFISSVPTMFTYVVITILAIIFACFDRDYIINQFKKQVPKKWIQKASEIYKETCSVSLNYIKAEAKLSGICFILVFIGLVFLDLIGFDVKYPVIMAIFIGFVDLLPLFGAGVVMIPWAIYLFFTGNIPLAIAVGVIWIIWAVLKQLMEPKMVSNQMGMHPIFTLLGMYTGFRICGVFGLMLGPIVLLIIKNVFSELISKGVLKSFFEME